MEEAALDQRTEGVVMVIPRKDDHHTSPGKGMERRHGKGTWGRANHLPDPGGSQLTPKTTRLYSDNPTFASSGRASRAIPTFRMPFSVRPTTTLKGLEKILNVSVTADELGFFKFIFFNTYCVTIRQDNRDSKVVRVFLSSVFKVS